MQFKGKKKWLGVNVAATAEIIPGKKTPVLGANHPYRFYAQGQIDDDNPTKGYVGSGRLVESACEGVVDVMRDDLATARWQVLMAKDPSRDPQDVIEECKDYWNQPEQQAQVCNLVMHEGSAPGLRRRHSEREKCEALCFLSPAPAGGDIQ